VSLLAPLLRSAGARFAGDDDAAPLLTFGDVPAEYRAGVEAAALFDATDRGRVDVSGDDRTDFLHRILSNHVHGLAPGAGNRQLLLTPKGKIQADFELRVEPDRFVLSTPPGSAQALIAGLDMFLFADAVELADASAQSAPLELMGPSADSIVAAAFGVAPSVEPFHCATSELGGLPVTLTRAPVAGSLGWRLDAGPDQVETLWRTLVDAGATPAGLIAHDSLRVEAGAARFGVDVDDQVYPQEARLEEAFALDKGCYIGQEVVAKIDTYGGLNKRLVALSISHDDPLPRGTKLTAHDPERDAVRELGLVTSWAYSFVLDTGLVLAFVKRRHQAVGSRFEIEGRPGVATVVELPIRGGARPLTGDFE
jgi:aminomethyltransferase